MEAIENIISLFFDNNNLYKFKSEETLENFNFECGSDSITIPNYAEFKNAIYFIPTRDQLTISLFVENSKITFGKDDDIDLFIEELKLYNQKRGSNSFFKIIININKEIDEFKCLSVYNFSLFENYLGKLSFEGILFSFNKILKNSKHIIFETFDNKEVFSTDIFYFGPEGFKHEIDDKQIDRKEVEEKSVFVNNFIDNKKYSLFPRDFKIHNENLKSQKINNVFKKVCAMLALSYVANYAKIENENTVNLHFKGYKLLSGSISYETLNSSNVSHYFEIFNWAYKDGNISDKVGILRNILSLYIQTNDFIDISDEVLPSILSSYEIYLKENVNQYIETKNKLTEYMFEMNTKSSSIVDDFTNVMKNNVIGFITFFISVVILNSISTNNLENIFTKEVYYISYAIIVVSIILYISSSIEINLEIKRFRKNYLNFKDSYKDIITPLDIERIFKDDEIMEMDISYIKHKTDVYRIAWIIIIMVFCIMLCVVEII